MRVHEKAVMDYASGIATARDEGRAERLELGEAKKARETAVKMLARGTSLEDITDITGLSKALPLRLYNISFEFLVFTK